MASTPSAAWPTTSSPSATLSSATRPWRTTWWSSTTNTRIASVVILASVPLSILFLHLYRCVCVRFLAHGNPQMNCSSLIRCAHHFKYAADTFCPLAHAGQSIMPRRRFNAPARDGRHKALPIIAHLKRYLARSVVQPRPHALRVSMALSIMDGFLCNAEDLLFDACVECAISAVDVEARVEPVAGCLLHDALQAHRQRGLAGILRAQRPDGLARVGKTFPHGLARGIELLLGVIPAIAAGGFGEGL